jgi:hypothetical protein
MFDYYGSSCATVTITLIRAVKVSSKLTRSPGDAKVPNSGDARDPGSPHFEVPVSFQLHLKLLSLSLSRSRAVSFSLGIVPAPTKTSLALALALAFFRFLSLSLALSRFLSLSLALLSSLSECEAQPPGRPRRFLKVYKKQGKPQKNKIYTHTWTLSHAHCRMTVTLLSLPLPLFPWPTSVMTRLANVTWVRDSGGWGGRVGHLVCAR